MKLSEWATAVKERDHHTCVQCGYNASKVVAHHIKPRNEGGMNELNNGVTLCYPCHAKKHKTSVFTSMAHTRLSRSDTRRLDVMAAEQGMTCSDVIRALIRKWLKYEVRLDNGDMRDES